MMCSFVIFHVIYAKDSYFEKDRKPSHIQLIKLCNFPCICFSINVAIMQILFLKSYGHLQLPNVDKLFGGIILRHVLEDCIFDMKKILSETQHTAIVFFSPNFYRLILVKIYKQKVLVTSLFSQHIDHLS